MLYNESTGKPKHDVMSLEGVAAWLETMPGDGFYPYMDCRGGCLFGQYMIAHRIPWEKTEGLNNQFSDFKLHIYYEVAAGNYKPESWTFGQALSRARKALSA